MQQAGQLCYLSRLPEPAIEISTMSLDTEAVRNIAHLARLGVEESENERYARNLSDILSFVEQLNAVDTRGVEPMAHPLDTSQRLRADEVSETDQHQRFQRIAPKVEAGLYLVPKVIE
jgi:aspartyl-tRNA(Asn)/glutamyl-tRNA(Gln) amidotransferase subunit C